MATMTALRATADPSSPALTIERVQARAVIAPLKRAVRTAVGTIPAAPLVLIDITTEEGVIGRAYIFAYTPPALVPLVQLIEAIAPELAGKPVVPHAHFRELDLRFRLLGAQGLVGMAIGGLDMALWDALARASGKPLVSLLGGEPAPLAAYDSYGAIDPVQDQADLRHSLEQGFRGIKIKLGDGDLARDVATVKGVRAIIGDDTALMVDYNQSLDPPEAVRRINRIAEFDIHWVEEPVHAADFGGHARIRSAVDVPIQTGENWFPRDMANSVAAGASDYAMLDIMKIGGVTGWMRAAAQAAAASLPVSSHLFHEASAHVLAVTPACHWLEHLDIAGALLQNPLAVVNGAVTAQGPGLGLDWDEKAVQRFAA